MLTAFQKEFENYRISLLLSGEFDYTSAKLDEWNEYTRQVTDWEISNYLYKV